MNLIYILLPLITTIQGNPVPSISNAGYHIEYQNARDMPPRPIALPDSDSCYDYPGGFYEHEHDCDKYYLCVFGTQYHFTCPKGLVFDLGESVCNFPAVVKCKH